MYCIVEKVGRGSWQLATSRIFEDRERAASMAAGTRKRAMEQKAATGPYKCKVVYMGDPEDWPDA